MRLDVHAHYFSKEYVALLERIGIDPQRLEPGHRLLHESREADFAERFAAMDRAHVDKQILSVSGVTPYSLEERNAVEGSRFVNDLYTGLAREMPARFAAFATLPMPHINAALAETARALDELDMWGVGMTTSILGTSLADPSFDPIYAELDRRGAVLFLHPAGLACGSEELVTTGLTWPLGAPFEDSMAILELLQAGFTQRFPRIRTIVPHLGGTLPFLVQRLDHMAQRFMPGKGVPREELRQVLVRHGERLPAVAANSRSKRSGWNASCSAPTGRFGKVRPTSSRRTSSRRAGLTPAQIAAIDSGNARALFGDRI